MVAITSPNIIASSTKPSFSKDVLIISEPEKKADSAGFPSIINVKLGN